MWYAAESKVTAPCQCGRLSRRCRRLVHPFHIIPHQATGWEVSQVTDWELREKFARWRGEELWEMRMLEEVIDALDREAARSTDAYTQGVLHGTVFRLGLVLESKKAKAATVAS